MQCSLPTVFTAWANASDGISSLYTAMSGRQAYMEGYTYAVTNMGVSEAVVAQKQAVNTALFDASTAPEEVLRLCAENGIDYLGLFQTVSGRHKPAIRACGRV